MTRGDSGYDGEGIIVGIIDSGIWPEHPSFADPDPSGEPYDPPAAAPPGGYLCEFGNDTHNPLDAAFTCNNKLIGAYQMLDTYRFVFGAEADEFDSARDNSGHGTHTSSTAAGNRGVEASLQGSDLGLVSGIAPRAHIIMYKGLGKQGGFGSDLGAAIDQAVADGVDVINYSLGSSSATIGFDDVAFLLADAAGVFVAAANGNNGPGAATIGSPAMVPWVTSIGASTHDRTFAGTVMLGDGTELTGVTLTGGVSGTLVDSADHGNELCDPTVAFLPSVAGQIVLCRRGAFARVAKSQAVSLGGGIGMILYNAAANDTLNTDNHFLPALHVADIAGGTIKAYIAANPGTATASLSGGEAAGAQDLWNVHVEPSHVAGVAALIRHSPSRLTRQRW